MGNDEGLGFPIKTQEAGEVPATFSFRFTEDALYVTGTAPIGEDQALIIADVLGECFGAQDAGGRSGLRRGARSRETPAAQAQARGHAA